ncbi:MAG: GcrA cell cycle regulator [Hyphomicrobiales bacterium]|nr:GcrA cell cycle regulator [Hyphomicrobiales bacterium]
MSWTDERVELLRKLWLEGHSASQIANELANGITRNAVIGKVHRLGLSGRAKAPSQAAPRQRIAKPRSVAPRPAPIVRGNLAFALAPRIVEAPQLRPVEEVVVPISERVTIMELRESMCRWPLGDPASPDFRYCGCEAPIGEGPYCKYHARIAYQPAQDRRRDRSRGAAR